MISIPKGLLKEAITIRPYTGNGTYGPTYGDPVNAKAHVEPKRRLVRDREGNEIVSEVTVYVGPKTAIAAQDQVEWDGKSLEVIESAPWRYMGRTIYREAVLK